MRPKLRIPKYLRKTWTPVGMWVSRRFLSNQIGFHCTKSLSYPVVHVPYYLGHYQHVGVGVKFLGDKKEENLPNLNFQKIQHL